MRLRARAVGAILATSCECCCPDGYGKAHVGGRFIHGDAAFFHGAQIGHGGSEHGSRFFKGGGAGVRIGKPADADGLEGGRVGDGPLGHRGHLVIIGANALAAAEGALHHGLADRVVENAAPEAGGVKSGGFVRVQEHGKRAQAARNREVIVTARLSSGRP